MTCLEAGRNLGFSGGMNLGIREALRRGADAVLLVNSDAIVPPDCVGTLERCIAADAGRGHRRPAPAIASGSRLHRVGGNDLQPSHRPHAPPARRRTASAPGDGYRPAAIDGVSGCVMLIRREVFDAVGLLDEDYFFSFEDLDFCLRARRAGYATAIEPAATAYHEGSRSIGSDSPRRLYFAARNHLLMAERQSPLGRLRAMSRFTSIVTFNVAHALFWPGGWIWSRLIAVYRGARDHLAGRYGADRASSAAPDR